MFSRQLARIIGCASVFTSPCDQTNVSCQLLIVQQSLGRCAWCVNYVLVVFRIFTSIVNTNDISCDCMNAPTSTKQLISACYGYGNEILIVEVVGLKLKLKFHQSPDMVDQCNSGLHNANTYALCRGNKTPCFINGFIFMPVAV